MELCFWMWQDMSSRHNSYFANIEWSVFFFLPKNSQTKSKWQLSSLKALKTTGADSTSPYLPPFLFGLQILNIYPLMSCQSYPLENIQCHIFSEILFLSGLYLHILGFLLFSRQHKKSSIYSSALAMGQNKKWMCLPMLLQQNITGHTLTSNCTRHTENPAWK